MDDPNNAQLSGNTATPDNHLPQAGTLLTWPTNSNPGPKPECTRTSITATDDLRAALTPAAAVTRIHSPSSYAQIESHNNLLILHDLSSSHAHTLTSSPLLQRIDPAFFQAFSDRAPYRPARRLRERAALRQQKRQQQQEGGSKLLGRERRWCFWEFPLVVDDEGREGVGGGEDETRRTTVMRLPGGMEGRGGKNEKKVGVVFCRAGLWRGEEDGGLNVLLSDEWAKGRREDGADGDDEKAESKGPEKVDAKLEDVLFEALSHGWAAEDNLADVLSEVVFEHWLELFDALEGQPRTLSDEALGCYWQMLRALEHNEEGAPDPIWPKLISRIQHRIALLSAPRDKPAIRPHAASRATTGTTKMPITPNTKSISRTGTRTNSIPLHKHGQDKHMTGEENQRALDRISYIGGILIPLPIVSGILSMGEIYGPNGTKFYVFWAVAIPLAVLTVMLIYADTIRKAEVWVEIKADHVEPTHEDSSKEDIGPVDVEVKRSRTVTWRKHQPNRHSTQPNEPEPSPGAHPEEVVFAFDHDVEERMIGLPMAAAAVEAQASDEEVAAAVLDMLPASARWGTGLVSLPVVILEQPADGSKPKAWKRKQLGWYGAIRAIVYKWPRVDAPMGVAASEKTGRPKAHSY